MEYSQILTNCFKTEVKKIRNDKEKVFTCEYNFERKIYSLKIVIPEDFPSLLPEFIIENYSRIQVVYSHVDTEGKICYTTKDNLAWDKRYPENFFQECCLKVLKVIRNWGTPKMQDEFREEFLSYWKLLCCGVDKKNITITSYLEDYKKIKKIDLLMSDKRAYIFDRNSYLKNRVLKSQKNSIDAYYLPLREKNKVIPPNPKEVFNQTIFKKIIFKNISAAIKREFRKWCNQRKKKFVLILGIPIADGNIVIIGASFEYSKASFPFKKSKNNSCRCIPIVVERRDSTYQISRTSQNFNFMKNKIAIIGLGSVGSFIAANLAKIGISKIMLVDNDILRIDNIARHYLGEDSLGKYKVDAMKNRLISQNPHLYIESEREPFQDLIKKIPDIFDDVDFIFSCVDNTMANFEINHFFRKKGKTVLYSWVDPYGIGYHNLFVDPKKQGCFMCLNYNDQNGEFVTNRASFAAAGQNFERKLASCSSAFVPYGVVAPSTLANNAIQVFSQSVEESVKKNILVSQIGRVYQFKEQGFRLSQRFELCSNDYKHLKVSLQKNTFCPECNGEYK